MLSRPRRLGLTRVLLVFATAALALPAVAGAKELSRATFCGSEGCKTIERPAMELLGGGDGPAYPAPAPTAYYEVNLKAEHDDESDAWSIFYVPGERMIAFRDEHGLSRFVRVTGTALTLFRRYTRGVEPFPAPVIARATVGGKRVAGAAGYAELFTVSGQPVRTIDANDFVPIVLQSSRPSPWTSARYLMFSPSTGTLLRGPDVVRLTRPLATAIAAGQPLGHRGGEASGFAWPLVTGSLASVLALALATGLLIRRSRRAMPE